MATPRTLLTEARGIIERAKSQGRSLREDEKQKVDGIITRIEAFRPELETKTRIDELGKSIVPDDRGTQDSRKILGGDGWDRVAKALVRNKADDGSRRALSVEVPLATVLGKALDPAPAATEFDKQGPFVPEGLDTRWLYQAFAVEDPGTALNVHEYRQTGGRVVTGDIERSPVATDDKALLDVGITVGDEALKQLAVLIEDVPNALLESEPMLRQFLATEMNLALNEALDDHVVAQIDAADVPEGVAGSDLYAKVRTGITEMVEAGHRPTVLALSGADAAFVDLTLTDDLPPRWPFGLRVFEAKALHDPLLISPREGAGLYRGGLRIDTDPYSKFRKNLTSFRAEFTALLHIRDKNAFFQIGAQSITT